MQNQNIENIIRTTAKERVTVFVREFTAHMDEAADDFFDATDSPLASVVGAHGGTFRRNSTRLLTQFFRMRDDINVNLEEDVLRNALIRVEEDRIARDLTTNLTPAAITDDLTEEEED
jgi:hypothetical protein